MLLLLLAALLPTFIASALAQGAVSTITATVTQTGSFVTATFTVAPTGSPRTITATFTDTSTAPPPSSITFSAATTVTLFLPAETGIGYGYLASVVSADACATTYGLVCTSWPSGLNGIDCPRHRTDYFTYLGTSIFSISTRYSQVMTMFSSATTLSNDYMQSCSIYGTTSAVCGLTVTVKLDNDPPTSTSLTSTFTGNQLRFAAVPITAGASKLASARSTSCHAPSTSTSMAAAGGTNTSTSKAAAAPTGGLYRAPLLVGAAGILVGAVV